MNTLCEVQKCLVTAYNSETCHPSYVSKWSPERPIVGQCAITSVYLHETFGYDIYDVMVGRSRHFFNKMSDGTIVDLTAEQFDCEINYEFARKRNPKDVIKSVKDRYEILKTRMQNL